MSGKLLLISDLEGCAEMSAGKVKQSRFMCNPAFFQSVKAHLDDTANKVAFLGDYFDQGDMVVSSINGIMDVYKYAPERVTIIVGNRDVNKFRLAYELTLDATAVGDKKWGAWNSSGFYDTFKAQTDKTPLHTRLMTILNKSMGAASPKVLIDAGLDDNQAAYLLLKVFSEEAALAYSKETNVKPISKNGKNTGMNTNYVSFVNNCRNLFRAAKIVHYDDSFKTLMSHAGGMDSFFFHTPAYYDSIKSTLTGPYFDQMEMARKALMTEPAEQINTFDEETYNAPLTEVVKSILGSTPNGELPPTPPPSPCYFLLQALGLKPDGTKHFTSFIQSCDNTGCKGPVAGDSGEMYSPEYVTFQQKLKAAGVNVVASGHVPHCAPVPLVYKRSDDSGLLFVLNDTSNGYRPADRGENSAAVTYVVQGGVAAGVMTIGPPLANDPLGFMFGEWRLDNAPLFNIETKSVEFPGSRKMLTFPARPENTPPGIFKPAVVADMPAGGRRRRAAKKTRKAKSKQAKKSKASRKH